MMLLDSQSQHLGGKTLQAKISLYQSLPENEKQNPKYE